MIVIETTFNTQVLDRLTSTIDATPELIQDVVNTDVQPVVLDYVENMLSAYPPPIKSGSFKRHATPRQLRYVMAKIRRGEWTGRTGALKRAWQTLINNIPEGVAILVHNTSRVARYVVGDNQQAFHTETGWPRSREKALELRRVVYLSFSESFIRRFVESVRR